MSITGTNNPFSCDPVVFANANTIISLGTITRAGNVFTFSVGFVWKINGVTYQNTAPVELTIAEATEGFNRIDNALLNTSNTIELQQGLESDTIALRPVAPDTNIILTTWNISGETIGEAVAPTSDATKEDKVSGVIAFGTNNYTATVPEVPELLQGFKVLVTFQNTNTVSASTLNVNGLGAFAIAKNYSDPLAVNDLKGTMWLMFDTANWVVVGSIGGSGGGASSWGSISGTLSAQTDLQTALNGKQATLNETNFGSFANALNAKTTLLDADLTNLVDSADSSKAKKVSWLNVWNYIKAKADAIYQATLVSGTNIKTLNGNSILGSGNLVVGGGGAETFSILWSPDGNYGEQNMSFTVDQFKYSGANSFQNAFGIDNSTTSAVDNVAPGIVVPYDCVLFKAICRIAMSGTSRDLQIFAQIGESSSAAGFQNENLNRVTLIDGRINAGVTGYGAQDTTVHDIPIINVNQVIPAMSVFKHMATAKNANVGTVRFQLQYFFRKV